jgi:cation:H+ antiporter
MIWVWLWTSLPELVVSISAALKWKHWMVVWNIFWSNIFNILFVWWLTSLVWKTTLSKEAFLFWLPFLSIALFAFIFSVFDNKIKNWEGFWLLIIYLVYILKLVNII